MNAKLMVKFGILAFVLNLVAVGVYWHRHERALVLLYLFAAGIWAVATAAWARVVEQQKRLEKLDKDD